MRKVLLLLGLAVSSLVLIVAPSATADDSTCVGTLMGAHDNVVVPPGAACVLFGATVRGNVKALEDSKLVILESNVRGSVIGDKADMVQLQNSTVRENIIVKEGGPAAFGGGASGVLCVVGGAGGAISVTFCEVWISNTTVEEGNVQIEKMQGEVVFQGNALLSPIRGNIKVEDNVVTFFRVGSNTVTQNIQVFKNRGPGDKVVAGNTVGESLQCFENDPPFRGTPNVAREAQGQCGATPLP